MLLKTFSRIRWLFSILNKYGYFFTGKHTYMHRCLLVCARKILLLVVRWPCPSTLSSVSALHFVLSRERIAVGRSVGCLFVCLFLHQLTNYLVCLRQHFHFQRKAAATRGRCGNKRREVNSQSALLLLRHGVVHCCAVHSCGSKCK